jgi:hypothetical protein
LAVTIPTLELDASQPWALYDSCGQKVGNRMGQEVKDSFSHSKHRFK